jgi:UDP-glucose 4-epimerase
VDILDKIQKLVQEKNKITFFEGNINDDDMLQKVFGIMSKNIIEYVIHFAAFKSVSESIQFPLQYYENNVSGTMKLLKIAELYNVKRFIFSSSATVYGSAYSPLSEDSTTGIGITNPYGYTKYMCEQILQDFGKMSKMEITILRYFNPVGAHDSGLIGDDPNGIPNNLMPYVLRVAKKNNLDNSMDDAYNSLSINGSDYKTRDGTCMRDFIHVVDLASAHVKAIQYKQEEKVEIINIGTGKGTSVKELVFAFIKFNEILLPHSYEERRPGDIDCVYCNCEKANELLGWRAVKTIKDIVKDSWKFILINYNKDIN